MSFSPGTSDTVHDGDRLVRAVTRFEQISVWHGESESIISLHTGGDSAYFKLTGDDCEYLAELLRGWRKTRGHHDSPSGCGDQKVEESGVGGDLGPARRRR